MIYVGEERFRLKWETTGADTFPAGTAHVADVVYGMPLLMSIRAHKYTQTLGCVRYI